MKPTWLIWQNSHSISQLTKIGIESPILASCVVKLAELLKTRNLEAAFSTHKACITFFFTTSTPLPISLHDRNKTISECFDRKIAQWHPGVAVYKTLHLIHISVTKPMDCIFCFAHWWNIKLGNDSLLYALCEFNVVLLFPTALRENTSKTWFTGK